MDSNYIPGDAPPDTTGGIMGMSYDPIHEAWHLDYPCRINGKATHLRDTIYGPQRKTQSRAMRRWLEFEAQALDPQSSLTFSGDVDKYIAEHQLQANIVRILAAIKGGIGIVKMKDLKAAGEDWLRRESVRVSQKTGKVIAPATIQCYKRYIRAILSYTQNTRYWPKIDIGKVIARKRPIDAWEMMALETAIHDNYPWFYPAFDFARTCPIRPEDQFSLSVRDITRADPVEVTYTAKKTGARAFPIIQQHQEAYFRNREQLVFCAPDGGTLYAGPGNGYYRHIWDRVCRLAGIEDLVYYDLRHHAVGYLRSQGVEDWRIVKAAGWMGPEMLKLYDPDNERMIRDYDRSILKTPEPAVELL